MDAEAYPEPAGNVLQILWDVGTAGHLDHGILWTKVRVSAFDALTHYEVNYVNSRLGFLAHCSLQLCLLLCIMVCLSKIMMLFLH